MDEHKKLVDQATEMVKTSHLRKKDMELLLGRLPYVSLVILQMFVDVCTEDPFSIDALVMNLKKKIDTGGNLGKIHSLAMRERKEVLDSVREKVMAQSSLQMQAS